MTDEELTERERMVVEGYRKLVATGGTKTVWIVDEAERARCRAEALEEAAMVAEEYAVSRLASGMELSVSTATFISGRIRELKDKP